MDEVIRQKYKILSDKLYIIRDDISELSDSYDMLKNTMKEVLLIDREILSEDIINKIQSDNNKIYDELVNGIIPRINNKI